MPVRLVVLLAACAAALLSTSAPAYWARTWDSITGYVSPGYPLEGTNVWVGITGEWPTDESCVPDAGSIRVEGQDIYIDLYDYYSMQTCFPGPTWFDLGADVGVLAPGWYDLHVAQYSNTWPPPYEEWEYVRGYEYLITFAVYHRGDTTHDGLVGVADLQMLVAAWASRANPRSPNWNIHADCDEDGFVNVGDLQLLIANWGKSL